MGDTLPATALSATASLLDEIDSASLSLSLSLTLSLRLSYCLSKGVSLPVRLHSCAAWTWS